MRGSAKAATSSCSTTRTARAGTTRRSRRAGASSTGRVACGRPGPYQVQAAIAAVHDEAPTPADTDWAEIAALYHALMRMTPSPVVELNLAAAVAMSDGPAIGLAMMDGLAASGALETYPYLHAARADLLRRLERWSEAAIAYRRALALTTNAPERVFLEGRLREVEARTGGVSRAGS